MYYGVLSRPYRVTAIYSFILRSTSRLMMDFNFRKL